MQSLHARFIQLIPLLFVLLWSTGFIAAKYALPYIEPFQLLAIRMGFNLLVFGALIALLSRARLTPIQAFHQMVVGLLVHAAYLGGVFAAIKWHMPAGLVSLLVGLQPVLTAFMGWQFFQQPLTRRQWLGLGLGFAGVVLVLYGNNRLQLHGEIVPYAFLAVLIALFAISIGTLYQKHFGKNVDLVTGSFYQYLSTGIVMSIISLEFEHGAIDWAWSLIFSLAWLVLGLSVVAILLLLYMIREKEAARVASYFYLVPPTTAFQAWLLFGETFTLLALVGVLITVTGVYLVTHTKPIPS